MIHTHEDNQGCDRTEVKDHSFISP